MKIHLKWGQPPMEPKIEPILYYLPNYVENELNKLYGNRIVQKFKT